ncbi:sodium-dependent bicarbonate transport family permease, partial [Pseudophaeobacter sp.]|uniref:sodium-dependent bicarbonate transport family permease n=1 Tax=Pseudophaeobacter sp. TaxID=1971739 RepID=UPI00405871C6
MPKVIAKGMSIYLLSAIGFKGGVSVTTHGIDGTLLKALTAGMLTSFGLPFIVFDLLKTLTDMSRLDAAHHCLNRFVTFVATTSLLEGRVSRKINPHFDSNRYAGPKWRNNPIESDHAVLKRLLRFLK